MKRLILLLAVLLTFATATTAHAWPPRVRRGSPFFAALVPGTQAGDITRLQNRIIRQRLRNQLIAERFVFPQRIFIQQPSLIIPSAFDAGALLDYRLGFRTRAFFVPSSFSTLDFGTPRIRVRAPGVRINIGGFGGCRAFF